MYAKLKRKVNKLYGEGVENRMLWQGLSKTYKDILIHIGAHGIWAAWKKKQTLQEVMGEASKEIDDIKIMKEMNDENIQMAKEMEPLVFETMELLNTEEVGE